MKAGQQDSNNGHWTTVAELLHVIIHYYLLQPTITTTINFQKGKKVSVECPRRLFQLQVTKDCYYSNKPLDIYLSISVQCQDLGKGGLMFDDDYPTKLKC